MQKRIDLTDLEVGMFVQRMLGSWFTHPFWKAQFVIEDKERLRALQSSKLEGVIIDVSRGKDVAQKQVASGSSSKPSSRARVQALQKRHSIDRKPQIPASVADEMHAANRVAEKAKDRLEKAFLAARLGKVLNVRSVQPIVSDIQASVERNSQAFAGLMRCKLKNELVYQHSLSVSALMISLARRLKLPERDVCDAGLAGLFLDIGVNFFPPDVQPKDGDFRNVDAKIWEQHVLLGYRALQNDEGFPKAVLNACLQHHERMDGSGFPNGTSGEDVAKISRMAAICDTFDFLLTSSDASAALDPAKAIEQMAQMKGAFDQDIFRAFIESVGLYPIGSFVKLRSNRLAMVIDEDPKNSAKPVVQAFYSYTTGEQTKPMRIALAKAGVEHEIIDIADLSELDLPPVEHLRETLFLRAYKAP